MVECSKQLNARQRCRGATYMRGCPGTALEGCQNGHGFSGARSLRHIMRLLDFQQPSRPLSEETSIPSTAELTDEWNEFANCDRLSRAQTSLGALG